MRTWIAVLLLSLLSATAHAQLEVTITDGGTGTLPIAVVPFAFEGAGLPPETDIAEVISNNFNRSGQFRTLPSSDLVERPVRQPDVNYATWRLLKQDFLVIGRVLDAPGGGYRVEFELFDVNGSSRKLGLSMPAVRSADMRGMAHQISDLIYESILGVRGAFFTRIAFITSVGLGNNIKYSLMIADADGHNQQTVVNSREPLMSPSWSPDGSRLAYVSFERGNSAIWIQEISTGSRRQISAERGINGAPTFSPDGSRLALTLSRSGNPEIYIMDLASGELNQITRHFAIDTEPHWTPDGLSLLFTSDRGGKPQIYQVSASGGEAVRITPRGDYNARASLSFDNRRIAMVRGEGNVYRIAVLDREFGDAGVVSAGPMDESPSFAPNGSMILYASRENGRGVLNAVSVEGRGRQRLVLAEGDVREPAWSPFRPR